MNLLSLLSKLTQTFVLRLETMTHKYIEFLLFILPLLKSSFEFSLKCSFTTGVKGPFYPPTPPVAILVRIQKNPSMPPDPQPTFALGKFLFWRAGINLLWISEISVIFRKYHKRSICSEENKNTYPQQY